MFMSATDSIRSRDTMPARNHARFLAKPIAIEEPLASVLRPTGSM